MRTQLPEKIVWDESAMSGLDAYIIDNHNKLIDYLKEREEPTSPIPPEPEWKVGDTYFGIYDTGRVYESVWDDDTIDHDRRDFLGIYRTKEEAEAVLVKVKAVVKN